MLVLSRKKGERIVIDGGITLTVLSVHQGRVRLGLSAPTGVNIRREELPPHDMPHAPHAPVSGGRWLSKCLAAV